GQGAFLCLLRLCLATGSCQRTAAESPVDLSEKRYPGTGESFGQGSDPTGVPDRKSKHQRIEGPMKRRPSVHRPPRSYRRLFLISLTIWLLVSFSIVRISSWIRERSASPAPPEREQVAAESTASSAISESGMEEAAPSADEDTTRPISEEERRQA